MKIKSLLIAAGATLLLGLAASAYEFQPVGYESIAMGGAGVASASGSMAGYYNPALLANTKGLEFGATAGIGLNDQNMADKTRKLNDLQLVNGLKDGKAEVQGQGRLFNGFSTDLKTRLDQAIDLVIDAKENGSSLNLQPNAGVGVQLGGFAVGVFGYSDELAKAYIPSGTDLSFKTTITTSTTTYDAIFVYNKTANTVSFNTFLPGTTTAVPPPSGFAATYDPSISAVGYSSQSLYEGVVAQKTDVIKLTGNAVTEIPISLATSFDFPLIGKLNIGASVKPMVGYTYSDTVDIDTKFQDVLDRIKDKQTDSTSLGIDVGATMNAPLISQIKLGFVAKNINSPEFKDDANVVQFKLDPLYRAGAALELTKGINIAADYDLSVNKDASGNPSRYLGGGISFDGGGFFTLRGGAMQNVGIDGSNLLYTAGLGIGVKYLNLNVAAVWDSKNKTNYDGKEYPNPTKVNVGLVSRW